MIQVEQLTKSFKLYPQPSDRIKELFLRRPFHTRHRVLNDISFTVADGEALGILGRNGAGKSTLLKLLTGVLVPDSGQVALSGKVTALLELGTGFDMNQTGLQNIVINGLLIGMTPAEIEAVRDQVIEFSELGSYIHEPLRTYSSGMVMRLAFAIAIHANPDVFIIDEALSVGDGHFQQKCMRRIRQFRAGGGSILFVSHDLNAVKMLCDRAIVLDQGNLVVDDEPEVAVNAYNQILGAGDDLDDTSETRDKGYGSFEAKIEAVELIGQDSRADIVTSGETATLSVHMQGHQDVGEMTLGIMIRDRFGQDIFGTNTHHMGQSLAIEQGENKRFDFHFPMHLAPGKYTVTVAAHEGMDHTRHCYHWWDNAVSFEVAGIRGAPFGGVCNLQPTFTETCAQD
ncbi:ABC transporter ATP-binding protein [Pseudomaricurvus alkylphenolicus]|uniref:ABC transporter ATP-binding protein n=1 Tax=Pseudomaricurvus alkylphenolicus TaxID=1306991 RepID=UPI00141FF056|nr:ABC transporter ATP-binding protein [Pseudomaricurvus alkylphenolicus]NIB42100.1 ABC transporter ATP-binding protein [Pseudomaricurvus alkylphenolicus]